MVNKIEMKMIEVTKGQLHVTTLLGTTALLFAGSADAAVITGGPLTLNGPTNSKDSTSLLIGPRANGIRLVNANGGTGKDYRARLTISSATGFVSKIGEGTVIGANLATVPLVGSSSFDISSIGKTSVPAFSKSGLFGYSFVTAGQTNYGWARLGFTYDGLRQANSVVATITAFAYTNDGSNIVAGQPTATTSVPEAGTLAMLASGLGLIGMTAAQRRRKLKAANKNESLTLAA